MLALAFFNRFNLLFVAFFVPLLRRGFDFACRTSSIALFSTILMEADAVGLPSMPHERTGVTFTRSLQPRSSASTV